MPAPVLRRRTAAGAGRAGVRVRAPPRCSARARGRARPPRRHRLTQVPHIKTFIFRLQIVRFASAPASKLDQNQIG